MGHVTDKARTIEQVLDELKQIQAVTPEIQEAIGQLEKAAVKLEQKNRKETGAWEKVLLARHKERPRASFYMKHMLEDLVICHGDRHFGEDPAILGGIGRIGGHVVTVIAQNRGSTSKENIHTHFGMPHPEGYRKALRLMKQAEKFKRPILCLIDTPGAYCGIEAEERGQGEAIARNLMEMARLKTPIISGVIGEGGSGGALAIGVADRIFMQENAVYSILSPEGFASILWKDAGRAQEAAEKMQMTADTLLKAGIIDKVILEPEGGAQYAPETAAHVLKDYLVSELDRLTQEKIGDLVEARYRRFRRYGYFKEE